MRYNLLFQVNHSLATCQKTFQNRRQHEIPNIGSLPHLDPFISLKR
jgi:hypothetical protein